uniref:Uncharacterized protein n=1 Tax=Solanum lycopersicum TaxID=4081 RepID=A0A3Q7I2B1_SOLLC
MDIIDHLPRYSPNIIEPSTSSKLEYCLASTSLLMEYYRAPILLDMRSPKVFKQKTSHYLRKLVNGLSSKFPLGFLVLGFSFVVEGPQLIALCLCSLYRKSFVRVKCLGHLKLHFFGVNPSWYGIKKETHSRKGITIATSCKHRRIFFYYKNNNETQKKSKPCPAATPIHDPAQSVDPNPPTFVSRRKLHSAIQRIKFQHAFFLLVQFLVRTCTILVATKHAFSSFEARDSATLPSQVNGSISSLPLALNSFEIISHWKNNGFPDKILDLEFIMGLGKIRILSIFFQKSKT